MNVELRYFEGCPNWEVAHARLREATDADSSAQTV